MLTSLLVPYIFFSLPAAIFNLLRSGNGLLSLQWCSGFSFLDTSQVSSVKALEMSSWVLKKKESEQGKFVDGFETKLHVKEETTSFLVEELTRISTENKKLTEMLTVLYENYNALQNHLVQRSAEDPSILVATYEGEHNHLHLSKPQFSLGSSQHSSSITGPVPTANPATTVTLDLMKPGMLQENAKKAVKETEAQDVGQILVQQMASSLTRDPNFIAALAAAISGRSLINQTRIEKWLN